MKRYLFLFALILIVGLATNAQAVLFTFSGSSEGGTGSATMKFFTSSVVADGVTMHTLTVDIDNTSPLTLDNGDGVNAPGISGFGFNLNPDELGVSSITWGYDGWVIGNFLAGISLKYLPNNGGNADGMLFNPDLLSLDPLNNGLPGGQNEIYYTTATLTMTFDRAPILDTDDPFSPFVRFQNVGLDGEGSLKVAPVPEPATMLLFGCGLIGLTVVGRKKLRITQR